MEAYVNKKIMPDYKKVFTIASLTACLLVVLVSVLLCYYLQEALVRLTLQLLNNHTHHY